MYIFLKRCEKLGVCKQLMMLSVSPLTNENTDFKNPLNIEGEEIISSTSRCQFLTLNRFCCEIQRKEKILSGFQVSIQNNLCSI